MDIWFGQTKIHNNKLVRGWEKRGDYSEYMLSLSKYIRTVLHSKIGYVVSSDTVKPWLVVKKSSLGDNAGLGLFAERIFEKNGIISVYFASKKSEQCSEDSRYMLEWEDYYYNVPKMENGENYMCANFCNDTTYNCEKNIKRLERQNNSYLEGLHVKAKGRIESGNEIKFSYKGYHDYMNEYNNENFQK